MITPYSNLCTNEILRDVILSIEDYPIPEPYCPEKLNVRAIVLGADPSNFSNAGITNKVAIVFGLENGPDKYFKGPMVGLSAIGLSLNQVYVQNLIQNYCKFESGKNKYWKHVAVYWVDYLRNELDELDPQRRIPVLLTAEILYHVLLNKGEKKHRAIDLYSCKSSIPILPDQNKLR